MLPVRAQEMGIRCQAWPEFSASGSPCDDCLEPAGSAERELRSHSSCGMAPLVGHSWPDQTLAAPLEVCPSLQALQRSQQLVGCCGAKPFHHSRDPRGALTTHPSFRPPQRGYARGTRC